MYNKHFGLGSAPFRITPDTRWFFGGGQRAEVLETLKYAITSGEGIIKVTGEVGTGKTMLCRMLQDRLPKNVEIVYLANPALGSDEILTAICHELGLQAATTALECQQKLHDHLLKLHCENRQVVIFFEEAQQVPVQTLEAIRLLSNLETRRHKLLQLVLFGQPELDQLLEKHEIRQLKDRVSHSFRLRPLKSSEVRDYVRFRLHSAGYRGNELFSTQAYRLLAYTSGGRIRRIHILTDKAMLAAYADRAPRITCRHIFRARRDHSVGGGSRHRFWPALATAMAAALVITLSGKPFQPVPAPVSTAAAEELQTTPNRQSIDDWGSITSSDSAPADTGVPLVTERLRISNAWLARQDLGYLTIQLLLTDNDDLEILERVLQKQPYKRIVEQIYLVRSNVGGRDRWNLLYGEFETKTKALAALAELPDRIRKHKPYLRSLNRLRQQRTVARLLSEDGQG